jgi:hypothetical protein
LQLIHCSGAGSQNVPDQAHDHGIANEARQLISPDRRGRVTVEPNVSGLLLPWPFRLAVEWTVDKRYATTADLFARQWELHQDLEDLALRLLRIFEHSPIPQSCKSRISAYIRCKSPFETLQASFNLLLSENVPYVRFREKVLLNRTVSVGANPAEG